MFAWAKFGQVTTIQACLGAAIFGAEGFYSDFLAISL